RYKRRRHIPPHARDWRQPWLAIPWDGRRHCYRWRNCAQVSWLQQCSRHEVWAGGDRRARRHTVLADRSVCSTRVKCFNLVTIGAILRSPGYNTGVKPSIFVVEDDPDISRLVRHHLEGAGFAVKLFPTGNTVVMEAERQRPTLFVLDIMVPGRDGLELC